MKKEIALTPELAAMGMLLAAMIQTHPDKRALRDAFALMADQIRVGGIVSGVAGKSLNALQISVDRYLTQIDQAIAAVDK